MTFAPTGITHDSYNHSQLKAHIWSRPTYICRNIETEHLPVHLCHVDLKDCYESKVTAENIMWAHTQSGLDALSFLYGDPGCDLVRVMAWSYAWSIFNGCMVLSQLSCDLSQLSYDFFGNSSLHVHVAYHNSLVVIMLQLITMVLL